MTAAAAAAGVDHHPRCPAGADARSASARARQCPTSSARTSRTPPTCAAATSGVRVTTVQPTPTRRCGRGRVIAQSPPGGTRSPSEHGGDAAGGADDAPSQADRARGRRRSTPTHQAGRPPRGRPRRRRPGRPAPSADHARPSADSAWLGPAGWRVSTIDRRVVTHASRWSSSIIAGRQHPVLGSDLLLDRRLGRRRLRPADRLDRHGRSPTAAEADLRRDRSTSIGAPRVPPPSSSPQERAEMVDEENRRCCAPWSTRPARLDRPDRRAGRVDRPWLDDWRTHIQDRQDWADDLGSATTTPSGRPTATASRSRRPSTTSPRSTRWTPAPSTGGRLAPGAGGAAPRPPHPLADLETVAEGGGGEDGGGKASPRGGDPPTP